VLFAVAPSVSAEYALSGWWALFATLGSDIFINEFKYVSGSAAGATVIDPYRVRLRALLGVSIVH
jgi:hypothetical protein